MAEAFNSLYQIGTGPQQRPLDGIDDLEVATAAYIDWYNDRRLHGELGLIPPVEYETLHHNKIHPTRPSGPENQPSTKPGA